MGTMTYDDDDDLFDHENQIVRFLLDLEISRFTG